MTMLRHAARTACCRALLTSNVWPHKCRFHVFLEFNIRILSEGRSYHVRCHENGLKQVVVFQVTYL
jgi:hypothetical protein